MRVRQFRKYPIIAINLLFLSLIIKAWFFDPVSDTNAAFSLIVFVIMIFYNAYIRLLYMISDLLYRIFSGNEKIQYYVEGLFYILLFLPLILLCYVVYY